MLIMIFFYLFSCLYHDIVAFVICTNSLYCRFLYSSSGYAFRSSKHTYSKIDLYSGSSCSFIMLSPWFMARLISYVSSSESLCPYSSLCNTSTSVLMLKVCPLSLRYLPNADLLLCAPQCSFSGFDLSTRFTDINRWAFGTF